MRRAIVIVCVIACALLLNAPAGHAKAAPIMNAIGLIDYSTRPTFKPGDWVQYRLTAQSSDGNQDDYTVLVLIAGEERFWGDDCFWVETRTQRSELAPIVTATLMSYSIFADSAAFTHLKTYMRKTIADVDDAGNPLQQLTKRPSATLRTRTKLSEHSSWTVDSLGADTVSVPRGLFRCAKLKMQEGIAATGDRGDSTTRTEVRDTRTVFMTRDVPATHIARELIEDTVKRKTWAIGHSTTEEPVLVSLSKGDARLLDFGHGMESSIVPKTFRRSLREQDAASAHPVTQKSNAKRPN